MSSTLTFADSGTLAENIGQFGGHLATLDAILGPVLAPSLGKIADQAYERDVLLNALIAALAADATKPTGQTPTPSPAAVATADAPGAAVPAAAPVGWFLERLEIEGFRGINNEKAPLALSFKSDAISSISAPNGVGKSSIYDALSYALTGEIAKLERLAAGEKGRDYYNNKFHPAGVGLIRLTLKPTNGGTTVTLSVSRDGAGNRTVTAPTGVDGEMLLAELNREFVLLDGGTFQGFIDDKPLDRGRVFAGLLGLGRYSTLRQELQALAHTKSFNNHFERTTVTARKDAAKRELSTLRPKIAADYERLVKKPLDHSLPKADAQAHCHHALSEIGVLAPHCEGKDFSAIDIDACLKTIKAEEGGERKERHVAVLRKISDLESANGKGPSEADGAALKVLATARDEALTLTAGDLLKELYQASEKVLTSEGWSDPMKCPTCDRKDETSVLETVQAKLEQYEKVVSATEECANA